MIKIQNCPSMLLRGYSTYSRTAIKKLFDGHKISPFLDFGIEEFGASEIATNAMRRISVSGVQEKFPAVIDHGKVRIAEENERSTYVYDRTGHPCRTDFERFGTQIGIASLRVNKILDKYMLIPEETRILVDGSFLTDKMKRTYLRIVDERIRRFIRQSD